LGLREKSIIRVEKKLIVVVEKTMERLVFNDRNEYHFEDKLHRLDGPAIEFANGAKEWWFEGKLHRNNGPAIEFANGANEWYMRDRKVTKDDVKTYRRSQVVNSLLLTLALKRPELRSEIEKYRL
jgi:hypothetical protein